MRDIFYALDAGDQQPIEYYDKGAYSYTAPFPTTIEGLLSLGSVSVALVAFIDVTDTDSDWAKAALNSMDALYAVSDKTKTVVCGVFYDPAGDANSFDLISFFSSGTPDYFVYCNRNYQTGTPIGPAKNFLESLGGTFDGPGIYIICKTGASCYVADKLHRASASDGLPVSTGFAAADLIGLGWSAAVPATDAQLYAYLAARLADHEAASVTVSSKGQNQHNPALYPKIRKGVASRVACAFSQKAVHSSLGAYYELRTPADAASGIALTSAGSSYAASVGGKWPDGTKETQFLQFDSSGLADGTELVLTSPTLAAPANAIQDCSRAPFTWDAHYVFDSSSDVPVVEIKIGDGEAVPTEHTISGPIDTPVIDWAAFTVDVKVKTAYPGITQPIGRILGPSGFSTVNLVFKDHAVTGLTVAASTPPLPEGTYTVLIDRYVNNAGVAVGPTARSFVIKRTAYVQNTGDIEGWGYFPREEGLPSACLAPTAGLWAASVLGTANESWSTGQPLTITVPAPGTGSRVYNRDYATAYDSAGASADLPGTARSFIEACVRAAPGTAGTALDVFDQNGTAWKLRDTGVGMEFSNGPFLARLRLVEVSPDGTAGSWHKTIGAPLHPTDCASAAWALAKNAGTITDIDWSTDIIVRLERKKGAAIECRASWKSAATAVASAGPLADCGFVLTLGELAAARATTDYGKARMSFGRFASGAYQSADSVWGYVRYGMVDEAFNGAMDRNDAAGVFKAQGAEDGSVYRRSTDILVGDPASPDAGSAAPVLSGTTNPNEARVRVSAESSIGAAVPFKLRLFMIDWDEVNETDTAGFTLPGIRTYPSSAFVSIGTCADTVSAAPKVVPSAGFAWNFSFDRSNRKRRFVLFAAVDSPLFKEPALLAGRSPQDMLQADPPGVGTKRSDCRYAARQFLPDFFVRDYFGDDGSSAAGGWLSPDTAIAAFLGTHPITANTAHALRTPAPNPQAVTKADNSYPIGFARGEPYDTATNLPTEFAYTPTGTIDISAVGGTGVPIKVSDTGYSDVGDQCYFNRMWVRVSNRGIVPGPARVQIFFLGAQMRSEFNPKTARDGAYQRICSDAALTSYVQDRFQLYSDTDVQTTMVQAIPALSGAATPGTSETVRPNFALAEFIWHVMEGDVPTDPAQAHSCRAVCVNLPRPSAPPAFIGSGETWSSGIDEAPAIPEPPTGDVWGVNRGTNNIAVRNSNIVVGTPPPYNLKSAIVEDEPTNFQKFPNDFIQTFGKPHTVWGLELDARKFPRGELILRIPAPLLSGAKPVGFLEIEQKLKKPVNRFFRLKGGSVGILDGIAAVKKVEDPKRNLRVYFQPGADAKPGMYEAIIAQTANGKKVGAYRTVIAVLKGENIPFAADLRTGIVYNAERFPDAILSIPVEKRVLYAGPGAAVRDGHRLNPTDAADFIAGKLKNESVNIPRKFKFPARPQEIPVFASGLSGAVIGRVVDREGKGLPGIPVGIRGATGETAIGNDVTDQQGRYLIRLKAAGKTIRTGKKDRALFTLFVDAKGADGKRSRTEKRITGPDNCIAVKPVVLK